MSGCRLTCPICERHLYPETAAVRCESGHAFDVAREGYVNLLPAQHRRRGIEGDTAEMVAARRRFLEAGHYHPLRDALARRVALVIAQDAGACVLEVGCGEGYYVGTIAQRLGVEREGARRTGPAFYGCDLSKAAVKAAARRYPDVRFFVADTHQRLYVADGSVRALLDVFAPRNAAEFARVLSPGGRALIVVPTERHLASVREELDLLGIQEDKERVIAEQFADAFAPAERTEITFALTLEPEAVADLVDMGPNRHHREASALLGRHFETEASFAILEFERQGA